jgi:hypothetical protein
MGSVTNNRTVIRIGNSDLFATGDITVTKTTLALAWPLLGFPSWSVLRAVGQICR